MLTTTLILFLVGLVAGTLNVIAGGGSMLTLPVMIFLGLPPTIANGTNRVAILIQNVGASWSFHRRGLISREWLLLAIPPALVGAVLGTIAAVNVGELAFQRAMGLCRSILRHRRLWWIHTGGCRIRDPRGNLDGWSQSNPGQCPESRHGTGLHIRGTGALCVEWKSELGDGFSTGRGKFPRRISWRSLADSERPQVGPGRGHGDHNCVRSSPAFQHLTFSYG